MSHTRTWIVLTLAVMYGALPCSADDEAPAPTPDSAESLRIVAEDSGLSVLEANQNVLHYQRTTKSLDGRWPRANYVHPLYGLDGQVISEDFPADHGHHRGVFWAWHQVWIGDEKIGDPWVCRDFVWDVIGVDHSVSPGSATIAAEVHWKSPQHVNASGQMIPILCEQTTITTFASEPSYRLVDFEISLQALTDAVRIGGSEDVKGYGGFSPRIKLSDEMTFSSPTGPLQPQITAIAAGNWVDLSGPQFGIAMLVHNDNPKGRENFILRRGRSMQNAVYPGRNAVSVSTTLPTVLRYRLVVHRGDLTAEQLNKIWHQYTSSKLTVTKS